MQLCHFLFVALFNRAQLSLRQEISPLETNSSVLEHHLVLEGLGRPGSTGKHGWCGVGSANRKLKHVPLCLLPFVNHGIGRAVFRMVSCVMSADALSRVLSIETPWQIP